MIEIRKVVEDDLDILRDLFYEIRQQEFPWEQNISRDDFDHGTEGEIIYVALVEGEVVSFISIWEPDCFVHNLFVKREARKLGVGYALLQYARDKHKEMPLTLKCVQENERAYQFYLKHGWTVAQAVDTEEPPYYLMEWR